MNKRIVSALVLAGMIAASSAFASNARNLVMGTGGAANHSSGGSFYYEDAYNFFYNPAYVNDYKNWAIFEKGTGNDAASFGFVSSMMNFNMGLFFNRNAMLNDASGFGGGTIGTNAVDLMLGGDMGVKWGLGLTYGNAGTVPATGHNKETNLDVRLGASFAGLDPFIAFKIIGKDKQDSTTVTKYSDMQIGARYHYGEWTPYAAYRSAKAKIEANGNDTKTNYLTVGVGRETKLAEGARLVYALYWMNTKTDNTPVNVNDRKTNNLPIDMAIEADALSWLTLRGGVNHVLSSDNGTQTTTARVGGTFHVAKVDVDYAFGNAPAAAGGATTTTPDSANVGFDSGTFHQIGFRYSW